MPVWRTIKSSSFIYFSIDNIDYKFNFKENAALCDEISEHQDRLIIVREESKFLAKKLKIFEPECNYIVYEYLGEIGFIIFKIYYLYAVYVSIAQC